MQRKKSASFPGVRSHADDDISLESLAELAELSCFHFSRVFKQTTGMTPLQGAGNGVPKVVPRASWWRKENIFWN